MPRPSFHHVGGDVIWAGQALDSGTISHLLDLYRDEIDAAKAASDTPAYEQAATFSANSSRPALNGRCGVQPRGQFDDPHPRPPRPYGHRPVRPLLRGLGPATRGDAAVTEDEAKTKWCPFARPRGVRPDDCGEVRGNRNMDGTPDPGALCIASACMAWRGGETRWFKDKAEREFAHSGRRLTPTSAEIEGYCGLAGSPQ